MEQNCVYPDLDDKDIHPETLHIVSEMRPIDKQTTASNNSKNVLAYARCIAPGLSYTGSSIGRVAVCASARGQGIATLLMIEAIALCKKHWPDKHIQIGAQEYLQDFYMQLGFRPISEAYDEDGIMHIDMQYNEAN